MSIVAVHGPQTFGSKAIVQNPSGTASAVATNPANGLVWKLSPKDKSQVAANYDWAWTPTTPAATPPTPVLNTMEPTITFGGAGAYTVTLTLNGVAQAPFVINAVAGVAPRLMAEGGGEEPPSESFDPGAVTVAEVQQYVEANPDQVDEVYEAELAGKNRSTLIAWLEAFQPA